MAEKQPEKEKKSSYRAEDITVLEGLEPVRKRPGMYIGTTGPDGLHHLVVEVFDNARDEAMGGHANDIEVVLLPGNRVRVADNGRGIPIDVHKQTKVSALETVMTTLHAGGKFGGEGYKVSGGLHGVGVSVVNALSTNLRAVIHREGGIFMQEYVRGKRKAAVKKVGASKRTGTIITFEADPQIFEKIEFDWQKIVAHMRQQAYLVKGMRISVLDAREVKEKIEDEEVFYIRELELEVPSMSFYFEGGLLSLVKFYNQYQTPVHRNIFYVEKEAEGVNVEVALQYVDDISPRLTAFANNTYNPEGGTHITGFKTALTRTLNTYARKGSSVKESEENFTGDDVLEGLTAVISVKLHEIQFEGQTKAKLGSVEARSATEGVFGQAFEAFLEEHPDDARAIIGKVVLALKARKAAKAAKDSVLRKGALEGMTLPGKLADCQSREASESEIFIVEGDSAGGTAKAGRDRRIQAILPLRGKILNIERARLDKMLASEQIKNLVVAMGTAIGDVFNLEKLRYHKIIVATDADVDGAHIRTLLLTLFYRHFRPVIDGGFL
ncbi:MAG TPA: DNA gyrase subunit B, partial [Candidatus Paceibacterota bacterium]